MIREVDYANTGLSIRAAMLDLVAKYPDKAVRPDHILWKGLPIKTGDCFSVATKGFVKLEILSRSPGVDQGVDLKIEGGAICLKGGEEVPLLRTWADDRYEDTVEYPYYSTVGRLCVWNVYKVYFPNGQIREEKWSGNAGFWVEMIDNNQRVYHCSHGNNSEPDFESLVFRLTVAPRAG